MGRVSRVSLFIAGLILFPALLFAQFNNSTTSPYSRYGLGDLQSYSFGRTNAMGGATLASRYGLQINSANPASYTSIDSLNFLFEFGLEGKFASYQTDISSMNSNDVNFKYLAMSFQISNWMATSIGLTPYSDVGYLVEVNNEIENVGDVRTLYYGTGTISDAYLGLAFEPIKNVSFGFNLNYLFGTLNRNTEVSFANSGFYEVQRYSKLRMSDFGLDFGIQATLPLKNDKQITFAAVFENKPKYTSYNSDIIQKNLTFSQALDQDTLFFEDEAKGKIQLPNTLGLGLSFVKKDVYEVNIDYYTQGWSDASFFGEKSEFLTDLNKFAVGAEWIPDKNSIRSFVNRLAYRAGIRYEQTYHAMYSQQIKDFGISFGVGIPVYRSSSSINVGAEFGRRGTKKHNLVLENYAKVNLSVNLHDLWFIKRRID
ncbi:MAG: hypothetical protein R3182_00220 [Draconibacterium sp.]|nr:hypothetical protein [Draconibacterium sp.]